MISYKKILLPFQSKYVDLKKYWWHRLFVVLFVIVVIGSGLFPLYNAIAGESAGNARCWAAFEHDLASEYTQPSLSENLSQTKTLEDGNKACLNSVWNSYVESLDQSLIFGGVYVLIISYIFQLAYYKVFLYVIFGRTQN